MSDNEILLKLSAYEAERKPTKSLYDEWAHNYENDLVNTLGYTAHIIVANALAALLQPRHLSIIDIGCGTGLVAQQLSQHGFTSIDGIDISQDMLAHAKTKSIYRRLLLGDMNTGTEIADETYDAAICAGSFAPGHLGVDCFSEIIRFVRSGGAIIVFMNDVHFVQGNYETRIRALEKQGIWEIIEISRHNYMSAVERPGRLIVARKT